MIRANHLVADDQPSKDVLADRLINLQQALQAISEEVETLKLKSSASEFHLENAITESKNWSETADNKSNSLGRSIDSIKKTISEDRRCAEERFSKLSQQIKNLSDGFFNYKAKTASELSKLRSTPKVTEQDNTAPSSSAILAIEQQLAESKKAEERAKRAAVEIEKQKDAEIIALTASLEDAVARRNAAELEVVRLIEERRISRYSISSSKTIQEEDEGFDCSMTSSGVFSQPTPTSETTDEISSLKSLLKESEQSLRQLRKENCQLEVEKEDLRSELNNYKEIYPNLVEAKNEVVKAALKGGEILKIWPYFSAYQKPPTINILNAKDPKTGNTPLMLVKRVDHAEFLIKKGASLDVQNRNGETAAIFYARSNCLDVLEEVVRTGADLRIKDHDGKTALMVASELGHDKVVAFLLSRSGIPSDECDAAGVAASQKGYNDIFQRVSQYQAKRRKSSFVR